MIALSEEQYEEIQRTEVVPRAWFGGYGGADSVPVKSSITMAVHEWGWQEALRANREPLPPFEVPPFVLFFSLSLGWFHRWIESEMMKKCNPEVGGYQIFQDVKLAQVDPEYYVLDLVASYDS